MFEIIMLLAFLGAATSQLIPVKICDKKLQAGRDQSDKGQRRSSRPAPVRTPGRRTPSKPERRNHNYAQAA